MSKKIVSLYHEYLSMPMSQELKQNNEESYMNSIKNLLLNPGYGLLLTTYGINVGVFYAISTLLNTTIVMHFQYEVGRSEAFTIFSKYIFI